MGIGIDHHDADVWLARLQVADGDGDIVEHRLVDAAVTIGMMLAACEADADAFGEGGLAGEAGGFDFASTASKEPGPGGQAEQNLLLKTQLTVFDGADIVGRVDAFDQADTGAADLDDFLRRQNAAFEQHVLGGAKFFSRKRMSIGNRPFQLL